MCDCVEFGGDSSVRTSPTVSASDNGRCVTFCTKVRFTAYATSSCVSCMVNIAFVMPLVSQFRSKKM